MSLRTRADIPSTNFFHDATLAAAAISASSPQNFAICLPVNASVLAQIPFTHLLDNGGFVVCHRSVSHDVPGDIHLLPTNRQ